MFDSLFGGKSSNDHYDDVLAAMERAQAQMKQSYQPYMDYGMRAMPTLEDTYSKLLNNPQMIQQMLGGGYQQSPGYQFQYDAAMNGANSAAAAGGLLGTQGHQNNAMGVAQGLANQDYWNYYNQNANLFNTGLRGTQGQFDTGFNATQGYAQGIGNLYGSQANLSAAMAQSQNQSLASLLGAGIGAGGSILGAGIGQGWGKGWF
jgi:hypothetical protein